MLLSQRLLAAASMVPTCECAADVGCDHGYIPIYLTENGICQRAIAMDLRVGPLERCRDNVANAELSDKIDIRLSDGLDKLMPGEAQAITILGMGGIVMQSIIENNMAVAKSATLVLGPQSQIGDFRRFLYASGFIIIDENFLIEDNKHYSLIKAEYRADEAAMADLSEIQYEYGPVLLKKKDDVFVSYLCERKDKLANIIKGIQSESDNKDKLKQELINIEKALYETF